MNGHHVSVVQIVSFSSSLVRYELNSIFPYPVVFAEDEQVSAV